MHMKIAQGTFGSRLVKQPLSNTVCVKRVTAREFDEFRVILEQFQAYTTGVVLHPVSQ